MKTKAFFILTTEEKRRAAADYVAHIRANPTMCVKVEEYKPNRSNAQNRLMWMWLNLIAEEIGEEPENLHEQLKVRFLGVERKVVDGQALIQPRSTTTLDTKEMSQHLLKIEALANDLEIVLPRPDDYLYAIYGERIK